MYFINHRSLYIFLFILLFSSLPLQTHFSSILILYNSFLSYSDFTLLFFLSRAIYCFFWEERRRITSKIYQVIYHFIWIDYCVILCFRPLYFRTCDYLALCVQYYYYQIRQNCYSCLFEENNDFIIWVLLLYHHS